MGLTYVTKKRTEKRYREHPEEKRNINICLKKFSKTKSLVNFCW